MASCKSCGADIEWVKSERGRAIPLDIGSFPSGNLAVVAGVAHQYTDADARLHRDRRRSHFVSCPDAEDWRQPR